MKKIDALVIGGGPAGLAAAIALKKSGVDSILVCEREEYLGGVLMQCIHTGFGLHTFKQELTGPEYAQRFISELRERKIEVMTSSSVVDIIPCCDGTHRIILLSENFGLIDLEVKTIILAMGCRERNRGNINISGTRPAGIMTAGLAQKMMNIDGYLPGKEIAILGSGDIGLIMARRLTLEGAQVRAVIEIQPYPGGLNRNIMQCLHDFNIPLYLSHAITKIIGTSRIETVEVTPLNRSDSAKSFRINCDTLLLSVGLVPENELSRKAGIQINPVTSGPVVDSNLMTSVPGIFACGNVLHVHDLADWVSQEARVCGSNAAKYIAGTLERQMDIIVKTANMVRYVVPSCINSSKPSLLSLRPLRPMLDTVLKVTQGDRIFYSKNFKKVMPSEMIRVELPAMGPSVAQVEVGFEVKQ